MVGLLQLASFICLLAVGCSALSVDQLIPFGTDEGDTIFFSNDDNTTSIAVPLRFPFYDRLFTTIHINNNGLLSFEAPVASYTPVNFPIKATNVRGVGVAFIAPFWADVDTREGLGTVFYRSVTDQETLSQIKKIVSSSKAGYRLAARFNPKWALIATWEEVGYYSRKGDKRNTFQVVVVTDELFSFTIFSYAKLTWVTGDASEGRGGFGGTAAMVGINAGDGVNFKKFKYSLTDRVVEVLNDTNMRDNTRDCKMDAFKGKYVYQIDTVPVFDDENCKDSTNLPSLIFYPCLPESISLTPFFGAVHTGGFVVIAGPNLNTLNMATAARIRFGVDGEELSCVVQKRGIATVICPVPLFPPDDTGVKAVTFTINSIFFNRMIACTHKGQYRVDLPHPFLEGAVMMTEADDFDPECARDRPWSNPVLSVDRFCLTWNADEHFARDQIGAFGDKNNVTVNVTVHYVSTNTTLVNHGIESGWRTINLGYFYNVEPIKDSRASVDPDAFDGRPLLMDEAAVINLQLTVLNRQEISNPVPVLFFLKVSVVGAGIDMFTSSPLLSFIPKDPEQKPITATQCTNIIPKLDEVVVNRLPCPATMRQAFLDPNLVVDSGCLVNPSTPNKAFNCYLNPNAMQCFLQRNVSNQIVGQCCYDKKDVLVTSVTGGGLDRKEDPGQRYFEHYTKDLWPIIVCCATLKLPDDTCRKILNDQQVYFKASSTQGYTAPQVGMLFGDPHFRTFDGRSYTFNGLGEYVLVDAMNGDFVIQIRTAVASSDSALMGTSIAAVAAQQVGGDPIQLEFNERFGVSVYISGTRVSFLEEQEQDFGSFSVCHQLNGTANVTFTNGVVLSATGSNEILDVILTIPNTFNNHTKGLLGTWNGNPDDDFLTSSGTTLPPNSTEEELFRGFGQTWMVTDAESLFFYRPGENSSTINQPDFLPTFGMPDLRAVSDEFRMQVEEQCGGQRECIYDAVVTGNIEIGMSTMSRGNEFAQRQAEALPPICDPECQNGGECVLNDTCSCTSEFTGPTCEETADRRH